MTMKASKRTPEREALALAIANRDTAVKAEQDAKDVLRRLDESMDETRSTIAAKEGDLENEGRSAILAAVKAGDFSEIDTTHAGGVQTQADLSRLRARLNLCVQARTDCVAAVEDASADARSAEDEATAARNTVLRQAVPPLLAKAIALQKQLFAVRHVLSHARGLYPDFTHSAAAGCPPSPETAALRGFLTLDRTPSQYNDTSSSTYSDYHGVMAESLDAFMVTHDALLTDPDAEFPA